MRRLFRESKFIIFILAFLFSSRSFAEFYFEGFNFSETLLDSLDKPESFDEEVFKKNFCQNLDKKFKEFNWPQGLCDNLNWKIEGLTKEGNPLIYVSLGEGKVTTLILSGVHPDELTPVPLAFRIAQFLGDKVDTLTQNNVRLVIAPLVNPDGFFLKNPQRTNSRGIDLNRNFLTYDWYEKAKAVWSARNKEKRLFPGFFPNSERETQFQISLINKFNPEKIISVHAPLGFLDYDGPVKVLNADAIVNTPFEKSVRYFVMNFSKSAANYKLKDYPYFPGSLGNFAGHELGIPTITLELESMNIKKEKEYWERFKKSLIDSVYFKFNF